MVKLHHLNILIARPLAYLVDFLLIAIVLGLSQFLLYYLLDGFPFEKFTRPIELYGWVLFTVSVPSWLYFIIAEKSSRSATIGKRLFGLAVHGYKKTRINRIEAFARTAVKLLPWEITHLSLLDIYFKPDPELNSGLLIANGLAIFYLIFFGLRKGKQTFHDWVSETSVTRKQDRSPELKVTFGGNYGRK